MPSSIGGLASGLNTTEIINAMLAAEQATRNRLVAKQNTYSKQLSTWTDLNSKLGSLKTAVNAVSTPTKVASATASSDDESLVYAKASSTAAPSTFTFRVSQLAAAEQKMTTGFTDVTDLVGAGKAHVAAGLSGVGLTVTNASGLSAGKYEIAVTEIGASTATVTFGGKEQTVSKTGTITLTDNSGNSATFSIGTLEVGTAKIGVVEATATTTLGQFATAINSVNAGVSAAAVNTNDGTATPTKFVVSAQEAGLDHRVTMDFSNLSGLSAKTFSTLRSATDAELTLADGVTTITRSSNHLTDVIPGVTLDLLAADSSTDVTVTVSRDEQTLVDAAGSVIDALNSVLDAAKSASTVNAENKTLGTLGGDTRLRRVSSTLVSAMSYSDTSQELQVFSEIGISLGRDGRYSLDETKLRDAINDDYAGTVRLLAGDGGTVKGVFGTLYDTIKQMVDTNGVVNSAMGAARTSVDSLKARVLVEDQRLTVVEARIRRQYTSLETTMAQLSSQANGLARSLG